ncbi:hypothetical protein UFOVP434_39 [uncultured Caudovirales phage]|uniref:Uncharacterized protein n=1 Tax=uncultured Caudovirales phage TaxID=2100421 RepID=A0A6J5M9A5_9CAUD|nr:hypothetical protein UFOVP434_39 [uncultured Caudovirales phage]
MPQSNAFDTTSFEKLDFEYDRIENELSDKPRLIRGLNTFITRRGKLARRPGTKELTNGRFDFRVDRMWVYETEESPQRIYLVFSAFNHTTNYWELYYQRFSSPTPGPIVKFTAIRGCNLSRLPHEAVVARGKIYIKSFPDSATDFYGSIIFDGSGGVPKFYPWGIPRPTQPARIIANIAYLNGGITAIATTLIVDADTFPAAPFTLQLDNEQVSVTSKAGLTFTITRAINGTTAAPHLNKTLCVNRNGWVASTYPVNVNLTWRYVYCYESITGQVSSRVATEADPRQAPSGTGSFANLIPRITVRGTADTVNIPFIRIYRTTDGGGRFYYLDKIANTGDVNITYEDKFLAQNLGTTGFDAPITDEVISGTASTICPSTISNDPPPPNAAPKVPGVDPIDPATPTTYYAGRIFYGIGTKLVFSGNEEITDGVPEECFPSGTNGNFYAVKDPITNLRATADALYVTTINQSYILTGQTLDSFNLRPIYDNVGSPYGHPRAITRFGNTIATLTHDFRIALIEGNDEPKTISDPLFTDIVDSSSSGAEFQIEYWADLEKSWVFVCAHRNDNTELSRQWVYDINKSKELNKDFWFTPWDMNTSCIVAGRISEATAQRRLIVFFWDAENLKGQFSRLDPTGRETQDFHWDGFTSYNLFFTTHLAKVSPGNHVNAINLDAMVPCVSQIKFDRTAFSTVESDPYCYYYLDDLWTDAISSDLLTDPPRREPSKAYITQYIQVNEVAERVALEMRLINNADSFELQNLSFIFVPTSGA